MQGSTDHTVSGQWASRPQDQRFLSLDELAKATRTWADEAHSTPVRLSSLYVTPMDENLLLVRNLLPNGQLSNWAFTQLARLVNAPPTYLSRLPAGMAADLLNHGMRTHDKDRSLVIYSTESGAEPGTVRAITSNRYSRIFDYEVVERVAGICAEFGGGESRWKVPGTLDWSRHAHNPDVDPTKDSTTLYASDRDVFLFLVDDRNPIEIGLTPDGKPDLLFRGFYAWNSEVGSTTFGLSVMYLRGVCQNRILWGVEGQTTQRFVHLSKARENFAGDWASALREFVDGSDQRVRYGVAAAKASIAGKTEEARIEFLAKLGFGQKVAKSMILQHMHEEGRPPVSMWDMAQAITAAARSAEHQGERITMERIAGKVLDRVEVD